VATVIPKASFSAAAPDLSRSVQRCAWSVTMRLNLATADHIGDALLEEAAPRYPRERGPRRGVAQALNGYCTKL
jgi:hypothetical protein